MAVNVAGEILKIDDSGTLIVAMQDGSTRHVDPNKNPHISHADAITTYKAQGISQNYVIVNAPADGMQTYNAMYVQATRGKYDLQVYTDRAEDLIERVKIEQEKASTLDNSTSQNNLRQTHDIQGGEQIKGKDPDKEAAMAAKESANEPQNREMAYNDIPNQETLGQKEGGEKSKEEGPTMTRQREIEHER